MAHFIRNSGSSENGKLAHFGRTGGSEWTRIPKYRKSSCHTTGSKRAMNSNGQRVWEVDLLRGVGLFLMIYFHIIYDMKEIFQYNVVYENGINYYIGKASGVLFIFASGISCFLSSNNIKRSFRILTFALLISLVTHLYNPNLGVKFGILHFLGVSILLSPAFKKIHPFLLLAAGTGIIILKDYIYKIAITNDYLSPIGITSPGFISSDYYPLVPWLGVFLFGLAVGRTLYLFKRSIFTFTVRRNILTTAGRNTLWIYLLHQPFIILVLSLLEKFL